jgi:hypothetical protein
MTLAKENKKKLTFGEDGKILNKMRRTLKEITISGTTFVTIDHDEDGLLILTHPDTEVTIACNTLIIKDPVINMGITTIPSWQNTIGNVFNAFIGYPEITNMIGNVGYNNGNVTIGGVFYSNVQMDNGGSNSATKEECQTPHRIPCDYAHINGVLTKGAMHTTFLIPLDPTRCEITLRGTGSLLLPFRQSFTRLSVFLYGTGNIDIASTTIGTLRTKLEGTGDIVFSYANATIDNATIELTGTGDIECGGASIDTASVALTGTGSIANFSVCHDATLRLTGTGDIKCSAGRNATWLTKKIKDSCTN